MSASWRRAACCAVAAAVAIGCFDVEPKPLGSGASDAGVSNAAAPNAPFVRDRGIGAIAAGGGASFATFSQV